LIHKKKFKRIWSIELDKILFELARKKFQSESHIKIIQGDSGTVLPELLNKLTDPDIFWLDAHYSGGKTAKVEKIP
jgi:16S rRNA A1518/A1519 N6-dimethyltransferase RsmA/KsgA/DIM1 with predicted DNA glycosylase/AP lyase activity